MMRRTGQLGVRARGGVDRVPRHSVPDPVLSTGVPRAGAAGFTLIELLVAVGAVALIALALAAVFDATGRTVNTGRRVSAFHSYASLLEQQLRRDFGAMTRDGFLVIRNERANNSDRVPLFEGQPAPEQRPLRADFLDARRIDEIVFFATGEFGTARQPQDPNLGVGSTAARIYYGHGKRMILPDNDASPNDPYYRPGLRDLNDDPNGTLGFEWPANRNPNRHASDWILARHVTVLQPPPSTEQPPRNPAQLRDRDIQVSGQPAASYIFRTIADRLPTIMGLPMVRAEGPPLYTSGLVDIATTDLPEIRAIVTTVGVPPGDIMNETDLYDDSSGFNTGALDGDFAPSFMPYTAGDLQFMQAWMLDAFPGEARGLLSVPPTTFQQRTRLRAEPGPTNYLSTLQISDPVERTYRRADQLMLSASNFVPHCTEFIVEWSFGRSYPVDPAEVGYNVNRVGQAIWHGLKRVDAAGEPVAVPYPASSVGFTIAGEPPDTVTRHQQPFRRQDAGLPVLLHRTDRMLIHGVPEAQAIQPNNRNPLVSYFGYMDPTFNPDRNADGDTEDPQDAAAATLPWPWPRLIRVTMTLADPNDPAIEETFQFVFEVPDNTGS